MPLKVKHCIIMWFLFIYKKIIIHLLITLYIICIRTIFTLLQFEEIHLQLKQFEKSNIRAKRE